MHETLPSNIITFLCYSRFWAGRQHPPPPRPNPGFTCKSEAHNLTSNGLKVGKWLEYLDELENVITDTTKISDTGLVAKYYRLTYYNRGAPEGVVRYYYNY